MTQSLDQVFDQLPADPRIDASRLAIRIDALDRLRRSAEPYLPADRLHDLRHTAARASERLALSRTHTVVALAGTTGSGKSSMFNTLAGMQLSPVGVRRPTTGEAHACVWGAPQEAAPVLDWVGVPPAQRFARESQLDAEDQADLRGLVLLDLPDFDSVERDHAAEVQRLLRLVDLVVWVVDPQKYADRSVHEQRLQLFGQHQDVMVVALNQIDLLTSVDTERVLSDLRRLLAANGLDQVPAIGTSAVIGPDGLAELRVRLAQAVGAKRTAVRRLTADVDAVVADLADLADGGPAPEATADRPLVDGLTAAAGLPGVTETFAFGYRRRAAAAMAWPLPRARPATPEPPRPHEPTQRAAVNLAARAFAERVSAGLPSPWAAAVTDASRSRLDDVPGRLADAVAATVRPYQEQEPRWWRVVGGLQWVTGGAAAAGVLLLLISWVLQAAGVTSAALPVAVWLLLGGLLGGVVLAVAGRSLARVAAGLVHARMATQLRAAVADVARTSVVAPVAEVTGAYATVRESLHSAGGRVHANGTRPR